MTDTQPLSPRFKPDTDPDYVYVIAEIGMTHDGSFGLAEKLTEAAIAAGADIIKYQWHIADAETLRDAPTPPYFTGEPRFEFFERTAFDVEQFSKLVDLCHSKGALACISAFSLESVEKILETACDIIKIPSGELTNIPMLREIATSGLAVITSSGMSSWKELDRAVETLRPAPSLSVLQCSSQYPCPPENVGLNVIGEMRERYGLPIGLSDHSLTGATAVASVVLGARIIEKHFTISRKLYGPDAYMSLEPDDFRRMVDDIRYVSAALAGSIDKSDVDAYIDMKDIFQKSIVASGDINAGQILGLDNLAFKKPGTGISAADIDAVIGKKVTRELNHNDMLSWDDIDK